MVLPRSTLMVLLFAILSVPAMSKKPSFRHYLHSRDSENEVGSNLFKNVDEDERQALLHAERVSEAGSCEVPKVHVIHVSDHYPGRYYLPHCTLLHRCGKHSGCCGTDTLRCVAAQKEKVTLHFYSVRIFGHGIPAERKIEKLTFTNHTRCGCVPVQNIGRHDL